MVIVGPEGGTSGAEMTLLQEAGAQVARLGPNVLRASTAGAVAVSVLAVLTGRWR
jgi:16S rRNA (uracil1498-N3)-methyltransferase